jgi:hypothetical protein
MPGFILGFKNEDTANPRVAPASVQPIYTYAWHVPQLFNKAIDQDSPLIYLKSCTPPQFSITAEEYESASIKLKYASRISWDDVKVSFYDTKGILSIIKEWQDMMWTADGGMAVAANYKNLTGIAVLDAAGAVANGWLLHGSWPKQISFSALTYTSSDIHNVDVTVAFDWAEWDVRE